MSEKVLGIIRLMRYSFTRHIIYEHLFITPDRVIVARAAAGPPWFTPPVIDLAMDFYNIFYKSKKAEKGYLELPLEDVLKADKNNYAIPNSEIIKVELKKWGGGSKINITTNKKTHKWFAAGLISDPEDYENILYKFEDYENILQLAFLDKLSVKK